MKSGPFRLFALALLFFVFRKGSFRMAESDETFRLFVDSVKDHAIFVLDATVSSTNIHIVV
jgi:hypothetical protein